MVLKRRFHDRMLRIYGAIVHDWVNFTESTQEAEQIDAVQVEAGAYAWRRTIRFQLLQCRCPAKAS